MPELVLQFRHGLQELVAFDGAPNQLVAGVGEAALEVEPYLSQLCLAFPKNGLELVSLARRAGQLRFNLSEPPATLHQLDLSACERARLLLPLGAQLADRTLMMLELGMPISAIRVGRGGSVDRRHDGPLGLLSVPAICEAGRDQVRRGRGSDHGGSRLSTRRKLEQPRGAVRRERAGRETVLGPQRPAVLFCERVCDGSRRGEAQVDDDLAEGPATALLLGERELDLRVAKDTLLNQEPPERAPGSVGRIHGPSIGKRGPRVEGVFDGSLSARRYLISVSSLNIGRYMLMMITPTMQPTPIIISGSMIEVSDWIAASTSSS